MSDSENKPPPPAPAPATTTTADDSALSDDKSDKVEGTRDESATSEPSPAFRQAEKDTLLTESENTNNENRVIEMESGSRAEVASSECVGEPTEVKTGDESASDPPNRSPSGGGDKDKYAEHITYDGEGNAIYTDPETKYRYKWSKEKSEWVPVGSSQEAGDSNPYENEHYKWCHETKKWIPKETSKETEHYRWCEESNQWIPKEKEDRSYSYEDGVHQYTDKDGAIYFWDEEKKAWFPKVDDHFMAVYQLNYGFNAPESAKPAASGAVPERKMDSDEEEDESEDRDTRKEEIQTRVQGKKRKAPPEPPKWFDLNPEHNTKVYVSNLPLDITEEEFGELMAKCGMVLKDPKNNKLKLKLYRDSNGVLKGDGLCHYIKIESVDLAINILDNYDVRGHKIHVQRAEFQLKGEYDPSLKPKVKRKKDKEKMRKMQEALFDWRPEKMRGERSKHERIVIIKNLFEPVLFEREVHLLLEYQNDLREECNKCGTCRRVVLFDRHPEGVAQVTMSDPEEADVVVQLMNGRFFGKRKLTAEIWDGRTKYRVAETEADVNKRLGNWDKYLEKEEEPPAGGDNGPDATKQKSEKLSAESSAELKASVTGNKGDDEEAREKDIIEKSDQQRADDREGEVLQPEQKGVGTMQSGAATEPTDDHQPSAADDTAEEKLSLD